jgi:hypothetical protein
VYYRDIFQFTTPLSAYVMAGLFWLFGTTMDDGTRQHGGPTCCHRGSAVRDGPPTGRAQGLAVAVALAYPAICVTIWPYASWHWFSTAIFSVLLLTLIAGPWAARPRWALVPASSPACSPMPSTRRAW